MNYLDWIIIVLYLVGMVLLSLWLKKGQANEADYYLGGRNLPWWAIGISTMATQSSAISFISIPAFVAIKPGGGLVWLQYELAVPLAMIFVIAFLVPFFRSLKLISVYHYLELRFNTAVNLFISFVFLLSRGLGTGVALYASALVMSVILEIPLWQTIILMGLVTIIYDTLGGMKAVVYSDVIQMGLLLLGIVLCIFTAVNSVDGNLADIIQTLAPERRQAIDWSTGIGDRSTTPFWGFLIGGLFLYTAYYGTDQSQVQRGLSAPSLQDSRRALLLNGFARFQLTVLYVLMGLALAITYTHSPELQAQVAHTKPDYLVPHFIILHLPTGVRALIVSAILAAAMSSLDSALNSLSAVTLRDFIQPYRQLNARQALRYGKFITVFWGVVITGFAFVVGNIADTIIESINKIGSAFYGPILAAFLAGVLSSRTTSAGVLSGVLAGVGCNLYLWLMQPQIFWMWWNLTGLAVALIITLSISQFTNAPVSEHIQQYTLYGSGFFKVDNKQRKIYLALLLYFVFILSLLIGLNYFFSTH